MAYDTDFQFSVHTVFLNFYPPNAFVYCSNICKPYFPSHFFTIYITFWTDLEIVHSSWMEGTPLIRWNWSENVVSRDALIHTWYFMILNTVSVLHVILVILWISCCISKISNSSVLLLFAYIYIHSTSIHHEWTGGTSVFLNEIYLA